MLTEITRGERCWLVGNEMIKKRSLKYLTDRLKFKIPSPG